jgi:PhnB protein
MQMNPYLNFNGTCEAAFNFYQKCLGGEIVAMIRNSDTPAGAQAPADRQSKIMHARLIAQGQVLMGSDTPDAHYSVPKGFAVSISVAEPDEADRIFGALSEGGSVHMPIQETFWAIRFGMFVDQFGIPWMVNCEKPS